MAGRVVWTESAWQELDCAASYIARDSPHYAAALIEDARAAARSLRRFPRRGRVVRELNDEFVRELSVKSYRLIYEIRGRDVAVLAFIHSARLLPAGIV